ncbi:hypothetical protein QYM36_008674 [Artemia franciscana]|uniref:Helicase ATP-binding domain-containing protein n=1 Tax=Artemia franciscana TaxID=6661 RepID=A0AA88HU69_ARTSF|nr:hypothetical protein QYM36_008674 [Artemia franciscana]
MLDSDSYGFPFQPYSIQLEFMRGLYTICEDSSVGIFESPTGTGKSLSIICGSLSWLLNYENNRVPSLKEQATCLTNEIERLSDGDDWLSNASEKCQLLEKLSTIRCELSIWEEYRSRIENLKKEQAKLKDDTKRSKFHPQINYKTVIEDDEDILDSYGHDDSDDENAEDVGGGMKILFASRTHSQLSQFVSEVKKWKHGSEIRLVTLASRQQLCINEDVRKLENNSLINERCTELKSKSKQSSSKTTDAGVPPKKKRETAGCACPYYRSEGISSMATDILFEVSDIEDIVAKGKEMKACPYYASRKAVKESQIILMPYNILFHKETRESCGVSAKDNVVIIDEAHNILETISGIYSAEITLKQLNDSRSQVAQYLHKYNTRLAPGNLLSLRQLIQVLKMISNFVQGGNPQVLLPSEFVVKAGIDNLNLFKIIQFLNKSQLCRKLNSFKVFVEPDEIGKVPKLGLKELMNKETSILTSDVDEKKIRGSPLLSVIPILSALCRPHNEGRIVLKKDDSREICSLKYLLLNPAAEVKDVINEARAVIVAGGTMRPISEFQHQLFGAAGIQPDQVKIFSFGHVIPAEQVLPVIVTKGPAGRVFEFSYGNRSNTKMLDELGQLIVNTCNIVPGGVIVFFSSYEIENNTYKHWVESGHLEKMALRKRVFREPKSSAEMDSVLNSYSKFVSTAMKGGVPQSGALLFSVVGGKMSEGINFSDDLGRCVIVVGLPYPNVDSPELKEKMAYLDRTQPRSSDGRSPGQLFYESLCMKAVNQSIGRAIRHRNDYASILLVDQRYERQNVRNALPDWLSSRLLSVTNFGQLIVQLKKV